MMMKPDNSWFLSANLTDGRDRDMLFNPTSSGNCRECGRGNVILRTLRGQKLGACHECTDSSNGPGRKLRIDL